MMIKKFFRVIVVFSVAFSFLSGIFCTDALAKPKQMEITEDGLWFGSSEAIYNDFQPKGIIRRKKSAAKEKRRAKKAAVKAERKAKKAEEKEAESAEKAAEKRLKVEQKESARVEKMTAKEEKKEAARAGKEKREKVRAEKQAKIKKAKEKRPEPVLGTVTPDDFVYKGLKLGASFSEMIETLGEPEFYRDFMYYGAIRVRYYMYSRELKVGTAGTPERVVDIMLDDENYTAKGGVKYGATLYHMHKVFGRKDRVRMGGKTFLVYENPEDIRQRILLELNTINFSLKGWRYTMLPLTGHEADLRYDEFNSPAFTADFAPLIKSGIDTSNVDTSRSTPKIRVNR